jgi:hypothetical protein
MVCTNHGSLPTAALHGCSPPPYTFVNGIISSKSVVHSPDPFKDALMRPITTIPPSITTTHHDGSLPSPLSYTLADDDPPLLSMPTQHSQQNLRERHQFQNDGGTKWEAVQLAGKLEGKKIMAKTIPLSSQPHTMMVTCPPHCPSFLLMTTLPSPPCLPNVHDKI